MKNFKFNVKKNLILVLPLAAASLALAGLNAKADLPDAAGISALHGTADNLKSQTAGIYQIEPNHTMVIWKLTHMGVSNYTAKLNKVSGILNLDPANPVNSKVLVDLDANGISTGNPAFDKEIAEQFYEAGKYPTIHFESTKLVATSATTGTMTGNLTFHGVTKEVTLVVNFNGGIIHPMMHIPDVGFSAHGTIKRSDFGVSKYVPMVGDDVDLQIEAEFVKK